MAWCCGAPTPALTNIEQEKNAEAPAPQEMSTNLLVTTGSNVPSPGGQVSCKSQLQVSAAATVPDLSALVNHL